MRDRKKNKHSKKPQKRSKPNATHFEVKSSSAVREYACFAKERIVKIVFRDGDLSHKFLAEFSDLADRVVVDPECEFQLLATVKEGLYSELSMYEEIAAPNDQCILLIDHITDPQNLGSIIRSAAFFGIKYVVIAQDRQVGLTEVVVNVSQGGLAHVALVGAKNLSRAIEEIKSNGFWVYGACGETGKSMREFDVAGKKAIVVGNEEKGLSRLVRERCDMLVKIPGAEKRVESLNVAVASAVLMQFFSCQ